MKTKLINWVLWVAFILAMVASISHLAWTFSTVERPGSEFFGWVPAIAVDAGLAALAYTIQVRKRAKRPTAILWAGVAGFAIVSALANLYHALSVEQVAVQADVIIWAKAIVLSATLPAMYVFLGEIISGDDAAIAEKSERQAEREQVRADRAARIAELEAEKAVNEAERLVIEAKRITDKADEKLIENQIISLICSDCGFEAKSQPALNGHRLKHRKVEHA